LGILAELGDDSEDEEGNMNRQYHVGSLINYAKPTQVILQLRTLIDCLDCETWHYYGLRITTKKAVRAKKAAILECINRTYGTEFTSIVVE